MKKPIIIGAALGAAFVLASPLITSHYGQSQLTEMAASIDALPFYSVSVEHKSKGYLSSQSEVTFAIDFSEFAAQQNLDAADFEAIPLSVTINVEMTHGLVLLGDNPGIGLLNWKSELADNELRDVFTWQDDQSFWVQNGRVSLFGDVSLEEIIQPFTFTHTEFGDEFELKFSGLKGSGTYIDEKLEYSAMIESVAAGDGELDLSMQTFAVNAESTGSITSMLEGNMTPSEMIVKIASITANTSAEEQVFSSDNVAMQVATTIDEAKSLAHVNLGYSIEVLNVVDYAISNFDIKMAFNNIDVKFIEAYNELTRSAISLPPEEFSEQAMAFFEEESLSLFQAEPEFEIQSFQAELPEGKFTANAVASLKGIEALPTDVNDQNFWLQHAYMDATVNVDAVLANALAIQYMTSQISADPQAAELTPEQISEIAAQQAPQVLDMFAQQGLIVLDGEQYTGHVHMEEGVLKLNGNEIPLPVN